MTDEPRGYDAVGASADASPSALMDGINIHRMVLERMRQAGHELRVLHEQPGANGFGRVSAVTRHPQTKVLSAGAGPAWGTGVAGY